jgi:SAM-dependent methyltransferase
MSALPSVTSTIQQISEISSALPNGMPAFVDFSTPQGIAPYLHEAFQGQKELVARVARRILGSSADRQIGGAQPHADFGVQFEMNSEILAYAMQFVREGKTVLELAGATGENAILLAFAGAGAVHVNDLSPTEKDRFEELKQQLPEKVREKLTFHLGDCLQIFKEKSELEGQVDLLMCRNLLHFFNDQQEAEFVALVKRLLKPGGKAICSACSIYQVPDVPDECKVGAAKASFVRAELLVTDFDKGAEPISVYYGIRPLPQQECSGNFAESDQIYLARSVGRYKWQWKSFLEEETEGKRMPESFKETVLKIYNEVIPKILLSSMRRWSFRIVLRTRFRYYNIVNLPSLFQKQGFKVEYPFALGYDGHLIPSGNLFEKETSQIGVIIQKV